jgi:hypothetical protein
MNESQCRSGIAAGKFLLDHRAQGRQVVLHRIPHRRAATSSYSWR